MTYPVFDFGVLLSKKDAINFAIKYFNISDEERKSMTNDDLNDILVDCEALGKIYNTHHVTVEFVDDECDIIGVDMGYEALESNDEIIYILELNLPRLFHNSYNSLAEAIDDAKGMYGEYLPPDFNYKKHMVYCIGCAYD